MHADSDTTVLFSQSLLRPCASYATMLIQMIPRQCFSASRCLVLALDTRQCYYNCSCITSPHSHRRPLYRFCRLAQNKSAAKHKLQNAPWIPKKAVRVVCWDNFMKVYARNVQICLMSVYVCGGLAWAVWDMLFLGAAWAVYGL